MDRYKIVTFNLRCTWEGDGINNLAHRLGGILEKIDREQPDVICFQEVLERSALFLKRHLPEYTIFYHGRYENYDGEGLATAIRRSTTDLLGCDFFWLSPTPLVPASRFPDQSECPRISQVFLLRVQGEKQPFWLYNNHLDHLSDFARRQGIQQVLCRVTADQKRCKAPVFLLGDFNAEPDSDAVRLCSHYQSFPLQDLTQGLAGTFHNFGREAAPGPHIDYIFADPVTAQREHDLYLWKDETDGIFLSDHYPICLSIARQLP